ncbi:MAG: YdcF family protein [Acidobacteriaceae bacterium]|nr:YdcF family protein [Acidobacteriaceae bacterium]
MTSRKRAGESNRSRRAGSAASAAGTGAFLGQAARTVPRWFRRHLRLFGVGLLSGAFLMALLPLLFPGKVAGAAAGFLADTNRPEKSDLIYLLGGDYSLRAPVAAALFNEGWAPKIVIAREPADPKRVLNGGENFTDTTIGILVARGVPRDRIIQFEPRNGVRSTADEARALRLYVDAYPAATILVVTSPFHARRARMALARALPSGVRLVMVGASGGCGLENWRRSEACRSQVETEWIKFAYYFFTFRG